jgi:hypothetical protein
MGRRGDRADRGTCGVESLCRRKGMGRLMVLTQGVYIILEWVLRETTYKQFVSSVNRNIIKDITFQTFITT